MRLRLTPVRVVLACVLVVSAGGFVLAARAERSREAAGVASNAPEGSPEREAAERRESTTPTSIATPEATIGAGPATTSALEAPEGSPEREAAERAGSATTLPTSSPSTASTASTLATSPSTTAAASSSNRSGEKLFGVDTESPAATAAGVVILLASALVAVTARASWALLAVALVVGVLALLDAREALHQHDEGRTTLVAAAVALAAAHVTASGLAIVASRQET